MSIIFHKLFSTVLFLLILTGCSYNLTQLISTTLYDFELLVTHGYIKISSSNHQGKNLIVTLEQVKLSNMDTSNRSFRMNAATYFITAQCPQMTLASENILSMPKTHKQFYIMEFSCFTH